MSCCNDVNENIMLDKNKSFQYRKRYELLQRLDCWINQKHYLLQYRKRYELLQHANAFKEIKENVLLLQYRKRYELLQLLILFILF